ncbi:peptide deformylase [Anaerobium acetethylicum]|uniref:Peptide deformylase n=1 Tax=Anaerobium acetethylicum TaxID=1619234 RepID=A0A1D3TVY0_9FIRM|nr:peptide deformylase [Anaerobium acetethylicum]SCP98346.1 peptide deformylase [Anaerobium acetethylicum]
MAYRKIRENSEECSILRKRSKPVAVIDDKIRELLDDMAETMYKESGVGLAAPQIGIIKRLVVIDVGTGILP